MTESPSVIWQIDEGVAIVRLNRPERLNALTLEMLDRLRHTLDEVVAAGARAILVTGEGRAFCSGASTHSSGPACWHPLAITAGAAYPRESKPASVIRNTAD